MIEYEVYKEYFRVLSKIMFHLLQDGCRFRTQVVLPTIRRKSTATTEPVEPT